MRIDQFKRHNRARCAPHPARFSRRWPVRLHGDARIDILGVCPPEGGAELLPAGNELGACAGELVAFASLDGCGAASSAAALVAKAAAKTSVSDKETNFSFIRRLTIMSRSLGRLRPLGAAGAFFATKEHDLNCRYNNQKDDRTD